MTNFWDLPKPVREKIHRMHLVRKAPLKYKAFKAFCGCKDTNDYGQDVGKTMPRLLQVSRKFEKEGMYIQYNIF